MVCFICGIGAATSHHRHPGESRDPAPLHEVTGFRVPRCARPRNDENISILSSMCGAHASFSVFVCGAHATFSVFVCGAHATFRPYALINVIPAKAGTQCLCSKVTGFWVPRCARPRNDENISILSSVCGAHASFSVFVCGAHATFRPYALINVIPAKAGTQCLCMKSLGSGFRAARGPGMTTISILQRSLPPILVQRARYCAKRSLSAQLPLPTRHPGESRDPVPLHEVTGSRVPRCARPRNDDHFNLPALATLYLVRAERTLPVPLSIVRGAHATAIHRRAGLDPP